jgi:hypothetical protein
MHEIHSDVLIGATPDKIWNILKDFDRYKDWNPFIINAERKEIVKNKLTLTLKLPGKKPLSFKPKLVKYDEMRELRWRGKLLLPGLFVGEHAFELDQLDDLNTKFIQKEKFSGILAPYLFPRIASATNEAFRMMNWALKHKAEGKPVPSFK